MVGERQIARERAERANHGELSGDVQVDSSQRLRTAREATGGMFRDILPGRDGRVVVTGRRKREDRRADVPAERLPHQQVEELVGDDDALDHVEAIGAVCEKRQIVVEALRLGRTQQKALKTGVDEFRVGHVSSSVTGHNPDGVSNNKSAAGLEVSDVGRT